MTKAYEDWFADEYPELVKKFALANKKAYAKFAIEQDGNGNLDKFADEEKPEEFDDFTWEAYAEYLRDQTDVIRRSV